MTLSLSALSGIGGSISIACWIVVFTPQVIENIKRRSTDGLSVAFIAIWLTGDVFNIVGAVMQGVLPTMVILAVYYTLADIVLLLQVWWYRSTGGKVGNEPAVDGGAVQSEDDERRPLRSHANDDRNEPKLSDSVVIVESKPRSTLRTIAFNSSAVVLVCVVGVLGWWLSTASSSHGHKHNGTNLRGTLPEFNVIGQVFGYLCSVFYLGSRVPQLLLNYRRKSTEGVSLLFFMFACLGNLTYNVSIFAFNPAPYCRSGPGGCMSGESGMIYARHIAVNASWIVGSLGTMLLDVVMFVQFFLYRKSDECGQQSGDGDYGSFAPEAERRRISETR